MITMFMVFGLSAVALWYFGPKALRVQMFSAKKALTGAIDDPKKRLAYDLDKAKSEKKQKEESLIKLTAEQKKRQRELKELKTELANYDAAAKTYAQRNDRTNVVKAAGHVKRLRERIASLISELEGAEEIIQTLIVYLDQYDDAISTAEAKSASLEARQDIVTLKEQLLSTDGDEGLQGLRNFEDEVSAKEDMLDAKLQIQSRNNGLLNVIEDTTQAALADEYMSNAGHVEHVAPLNIGHTHHEPIPSASYEHRSHDYHSNSHSHSDHHSHSNHDSYSSHSSDSHSGHDSGSDCGGGGGCD